MQMNSNVLHATQSVTHLVHPSRNSLDMPLGEVMLTRSSKNFNISHTDRTVVLFYSDGGGGVKTPGLLATW